ncbi:MAG: hypothetical protein AAGF12_36870 [Myxococcota bacterium]
MSLDDPEAVQAILERNRRVAIIAAAAGFGTSLVVWLAVGFGFPGTDQALTLGAGLAGGIVVSLAMYLSLRRSVFAPVAAAPEASMSSEEQRRLRSEMANAPLSVESPETAKIDAADEKMIAELRAVQRGNQARKLLAWVLILVPGIPFVILATVTSGLLVGLPVSVGVTVAWALLVLKFLPERALSPDSDS